MNYILKPEDLKKVFIDVEFIWGNQQNPVHTVI